MKQWAIVTENVCWDSWRAAIDWMHRSRESLKCNLVSWAYGRNRRRNSAEKIKARTYDESLHILRTESEIERCRRAMLALVL